MLKSLKLKMLKMNSIAMGALPLLTLACGVGSPSLENEESPIEVQLKSKTSTTFDGQTFLDLALPIGTVLTSGSLLGLSNLNLPSNQRILFSKQKGSPIVSYQVENFISKQSHTFEVTFNHSQDDEKTLGLIKSQLTKLNHSTYLPQAFKALEVQKTSLLSVKSRMGLLDQTTFLHDELIMVEKDTNDYNVRFMIVFPLSKYQINVTFTHFPASLPIALLAPKLNDEVGFSMPFTKFFSYEFTKIPWNDTRLIAFGVDLGFIKVLPDDIKFLTLSKLANTSWFSYEIVDFANNKVSLMVDYRSDLTTKSAY